MYKTLFIIAALSITSACTWVEITEQGKQVLIADQSFVANCRKVGNVNTKTRSVIVGDSPRNKEKVANELKTLARNEAVKISANTLVAKAPPKDGEQQFDAYFCYRQ